MREPTEYQTNRRRVAAALVVAAITNGCVFVIFLSGVDDRQELGRRKRGPADERAADVGEP